MLVQVWLRARLLVGYKYSHDYGYTCNRESTEVVNILSIGVGAGVDISATSNDRTGMAVAGLSPVLYLFFRQTFLFHFLHWVHLAGPNYFSRHLTEERNPLR